MEKFLVDGPPELAPGLAMVGPAGDPREHKASEEVLAGQFFGEVSGYLRQN